MAKGLGCLLPYKVRYWEQTRKHIRKAGYLRSGDIVHWKNSFWLVQKVSPECSVVRLYLKNLQTGETYRNWHDWEQPLFKVIAFAGSETTASALVRHFQSTKEQRK